MSSQDSPDMNRAAERRQPRPAADLQGRDPVDPRKQDEATPAYVQHIYRLQESHDRILRRMHDRLGYRSKQDTMRWILDNLCQPWLEGQIEVPDQHKR